MSLTAIQTTDGYEYVITLFGVTKRQKRDGRIPSTTGVVGDYGNGYDSSFTFGGSTVRQKRKGRNPSTSSSLIGVSTKIVNDSYVIQSIGDVVVASIETYKSQNEIDAESGEEE